MTLKLFLRYFVIFLFKILRFDLIYDLAEFQPGDRAKIVKLNDQLHPEGKFSKRPDTIYNIQYTIWAPGERSRVVKRDDNLHPEGDFHKRPDATWAPGERANVVKRVDQLHPEGEFTKRPDTVWAPG